MADRLRPNQLWPIFRPTLANCGLDRLWPNQFRPIFVFLSFDRLWCCCVLVKFSGCVCCVLCCCVVVVVCCVVVCCCCCVLCCGTTPRGIDMSTISTTPVTRPELLGSACATITDSDSLLGCASERSCSNASTTSRWNTRAQEGARPLNRCQLGSACPFRNSTPHCCPLTAIDETSLACKTWVRRFADSNSAQPVPGIDHSCPHGIIPPQLHHVLCPSDCLEVISRTRALSPL